LSKYDGVLLDIAKSDGKKYTLTLKDTLLPKSPNGREQSTVSWEYDFNGDKEDSKVFVKWDNFMPTYRGREQKDAKPLDLKNVKRISLMMRSFFGTQEGDFSLSIASITAFKKSDGGIFELYRADPNGKEDSRSKNERSDSSSSKNQSWLAWLISHCGDS